MVTLPVPWFIFAIVVYRVAKDLNAMSFPGFPVGYDMAVQGSLAIFVVLIFSSISGKTGLATNSICAARSRAHGRKRQKRLHR